VNRPTSSVGHSEESSRRRLTCRLSCLAVRSLGARAVPRSGTGEQVPFRPPRLRCRSENQHDPRPALPRWEEGNDEFVTDAPDRVTDRNRRLRSRGQTPFAVLVSCSDSRVPPELLFGRGLVTSSSSGTQAIPGHHRPWLNPVCGGGTGSAGGRAGAREVRGG
jgi:hypothetical protein